MFVCGHRLSRHIVLLKHAVTQCGKFLFSQRSQHMRETVKKHKILATNPPSSTSLTASQAKGTPRHSQFIGPGLFYRCKTKISATPFYAYGDCCHSSQRYKALREFRKASPDAGLSVLVIGQHSSPNLSASIFHYEGTSVHKGTATTVRRKFLFPNSSCSDDARRNWFLTCTFLQRQE